MKKASSILMIAVTIITLYSCTGNKYKFGRTVDSGFEIISMDSLLTLVQYRTFQYFHDGAEPVSGMARERYHVDGVYPQNDKNVITTGGSGFGIMAILAGIERGFITREEGLERMLRMVNSLNKADRYHGAWSHWIYGETGKTKPFSPKDNGADIVETAFLIQGLLTAKQYFIDGNDNEKKLAAEIDTLWREVNWSWFTKEGGNVLYWYWSPEHNWDMNLPVRGWDECLILYILASASPTYPVPAAVYHKGWARNGAIVSTREKYGHQLILNHNNAEEYGGPLFWSHYSFLGLDPRELEDRYANYWQVNLNHTLINRQWCIENPGGFSGYGSNCWGLTASYSPSGYAAHGSIIRPVKELKGFQKISLTPGESKIVTFSVTAKDLAFYNIKNEFRAEPGKFHLFIGADSETLNQA